jgi:hypothetical protein
MIGFTTSGNLLSPIIFVLIGFLTSFFSKNMLIVLIVPLIITNILNSSVSNMEGMDNEEEPKSKSKPKEEKEEKDLIPDPEDMKEKYTELFKLQDAILEGMNKVTESLDKAEPILHKLKEKFQSS